MGLSFGIPPVVDVRQELDKDRKGDAMLAVNYKQYVEMHAKIKGCVELGSVNPLEGQCPRGLDYCDNEGKFCRAFAGYEGVGRVVFGEEVVILCAEAEGAHPDLVAHSQQRYDGR